MTERSAKRLLILLSLAWMVAIGLFLFRQHTDPELEALRRHQFEQKMNDCRGTFAERYECTSALLRKQSSDKANWWALRLLLLFGPPLGACAAYATWWNVRERRREATREHARLERLEQEHVAEAAAKAQREEVPVREIDEIRRRAEERRRAAKEQHGASPAAGDADEGGKKDPPAD